MHPNFRLFPALLVKISGHETQPGSSHRTWATAGFEQSLPLFLFCLRYSARQMGTPNTKWTPRFVDDINQSKELCFPPICTIGSLTR